jgi:hypothetical protein
VFWAVTQYSDNGDLLVGLRVCLGVSRNCSEADSNHPTFHHLFTLLSCCFLVQDPQNGGRSVSAVAGRVQQVGEPQRATPRAAGKLSELVVWGAAALWPSGAREEACAGQRSLQRGNERICPSHVSYSLQHSWTCLQFPLYRPS